VKNKLICVDLKHMLGIDSTVMSYGNLLRWYMIQERMILIGLKRCIKYEVEVL